MAGSRKPGSLGTLPEVHDLNDGTMIRGLTSVPGSIGADASIRKHSKSSADIVPKHSGLRKPSPVSPETLKKGSRGSKVRKLQRQLNTSLSPSPSLRPTEYLVREHIRRWSSTSELSRFQLMES